jgi:hypothetical protein
MSIPREFVFTRYPARQGVVWMRTAYAMFSRHRAAWVLLVVAYFFALYILRTIPYAGPYLMTIMKPVFAVGLLAAAWNQERGGAPRARDLFQGFRANLWALVLIGVFFVAGITLALYGSSLVDGGRLLDLMGGRAQTQAELAAALADPMLEVGMLFSVLLSVPVVVATWWAPALVVFQDASAPAALLASVRAALANWKALVMYTLTVFLYAGVIPGVVISLLSLVLGERAMEVLLVALLLPYSLFIAATLHVSDYVSYREVFHANETLAPLSHSD